jgi:hypothetical protein
MMGQKSRLGDRRACIRFEVAGDLWASFEIRQDVVLRNIGPGGAMVEATIPGGGRRPLRAAQLSLGDLGPELPVIIRHMTPDPQSRTADRFLLGVEFVNLSPSVQAGLDRFVREWAEQSQP